MTYSGRVYDGPLEGHHHASHYPYFYTAISAPLTGFMMDLEAPVPDNITHRKYRWSEPLHGWVFVWEE